VTEPILASAAPLQLIEKLERASRRSRPFIIVGLIAIVAAFAAMAVYLNQQKNDAQQREARATARAAQLEEAYRALERGDRAGAQRLLNGVIQEERQSGAEAPAQAPAAPRPAQVALDSLRLVYRYCDDANAQVARRALGASDMPRARLARLRVETNAQGLYRLSRNEIRHNPEEEDAAEELRVRLRAATGEDFAKVLTYYPSPGQLNAFFCRGTQPTPLPSTLTPPASPPRKS